MIDETVIRTSKERAKLPPLVNRLIAQGDEEAATEIVRLRGIITSIADVIRTEYPGTADQILKELDTGQLWDSTKVRS